MISIITPLRYDLVIQSDVTLVILLIHLPHFKPFKYMTKAKSPKKTAVKKTAKTRKPTAKAKTVQETKAQNAHSGVTPEPEY